jgi:hypothetical protein
MPRGRSRTDLSAVPVHDALYGCQPDSDSRKLVLPMQALKWLEQLFRVRHVKPDAVVGHTKGPLASCIGGIHANRRRRLARRVFPGVSKQIAQHHLDHPGVGTRRQPRLDLPADLAHRLVAREFRKDGLGPFGQVDPVAPQFAPDAAR